MVSMFNESFADAALWATACKLPFPVLHISNDFKSESYSQKERSSTTALYELSV